MSFEIIYGSDKHDVGWLIWGKPGINCYHDLLWFTVVGPMRYRAASSIYCIQDSNVNADFEPWDYVRVYRLDSECLQLLKDVTREQKVDFHLALPDNTYATL